MPCFVALVACGSSGGAGVGSSELALVQGRVLADDGSELSKVTVRAGTRSVETDKDGKFVIEIAADKEERIAVESDDFAGGGVLLKLDKGAKATVVLDVTGVHSLKIPDAEKGGRFEGDDGFALELPKNALRSADGAEVKGEAWLRYAALREPTAMRAAPELRATDKDRDVRLESEGLVELRFYKDDQRLGFEGEAQIELPLPDGSSLKTGDELELYHYDTRDHRFKRETSAEVNEDGKWVAKVDKFSWWCAGRILEQSACVSAELRTANDAPAAGALVVGRGRSGLWLSTALAGADGRVCIEAPPDAALQLTALWQDAAGERAWTAAAQAPESPGMCGIDSCADLGVQSFAGEPIDDAGEPIDDAGEPIDDASEPIDDASQPADDASEPIDDASQPADDASEPIDDASQPVDDAGEMDAAVPDAAEDAGPSDEDAGDARTATTPNVYQSAVQSAGPALHYRFDETNGNAINYGSLGPAFDAVYTGTPTRAVPTDTGDFGVQFDSADDYLESLGVAPQAFTGNPSFTAEALVFVPSQAAASLWGPLLHWGDGGPGASSERTGLEVYFSFSNSEPREFFAGFYNAGLQTAAPLALGRWRHVVWVRAGGGDAQAGSTLYIDGQAVATVPDPDLCCNSTVPNVLPSSFRVNRARNETRYFTGTLDELALYGRALTPSEVAALYQAALAAGLVDGACGPATSSAPGCADGVRRGLTSITRYPDIAVCAGAWETDVGSAGTLCASGFHVCTGQEPALRAISYEEASCFAGCFALDAAQDSNVCLSDCSSQIGVIDSAELIDMAGMGADCPYRFPGSGSCISGGRIDASENDGIGCGYAPRLSGVVCCRD